MKEYKLAFGTIIILEEQLAEVIIDEGVVIDEVVLDICHDFLLSYFKASFSILLNKKNSYSYTFEAQKILFNLKEVHRVAVLAATSGAYMSAETLIKMNESNHLNMQLFEKREYALEWLESKCNISA